MGQRLCRRYPLHSSYMTSQTQQSMYHCHTPHMASMAHYPGPLSPQRMLRTALQQLMSMTRRCTSRMASMGRSPSQPRQQDSQRNSRLLQLSTVLQCSRCTVWMGQRLCQQYPEHSSYMTSQTQQSMCQYHTPHMVLMGCRLYPLVHLGIGNILSNQQNCKSQQGMRKRRHRMVSRDLSPSQPYLPGI